MKRALDRGITLLIVTTLLVVGGLLVVVLVGRINATHRRPGQQELPSPSGGVALTSMGPATSRRAAAASSATRRAGTRASSWCRRSAIRSKAGASARLPHGRAPRPRPGPRGDPRGGVPQLPRRGAEGPAITQPHSKSRTSNCLDCHGDYVHLPDSHVGRDQTECWFCHKPLPPPSFPHMPQLPPVGAGGRAADGPRPARRHDLPALPRDPAGSPPPPRPRSRRAAGATAGRRSALDPPRPPGGTR